MARTRHHVAFALLALMALAACGPSAAASGQLSVAAAGTEASPNAVPSVVLSVGAVQQPTAATVTPTPSELTSSNATVPSFSHIYMLVMENREFSDIVGSSEAPYINELISKYGLATNYKAIAHPSFPNYIALFSGSTQGITDDKVHNINATSLLDQIEAKGKTWKAYAQNMPGNCFAGGTASGGEDGAGEYLRRHNPAISFVGISESLLRCGNISNFKHFDPSAADFEFIAPNACNDMHSCEIAQGDAFLKDFVPKILNGRAWQDGGVLFIVWDEGTTKDGGGGKVPLIVISNLVKPGFQSSKSYTHYSLLRTIEDAWNMECLVNACSASNLAEFFQ